MLNSCNDGNQSVGGSAEIILAIPLTPLGKLYSPSTVSLSKVRLVKGMEGESLFIGEKRKKMKM